MPLVVKEAYNDRFDPDPTSQKIVALGIKADSITLEAHRHQKAQLIYCTRGMLTVEVENDVWLVPPQRALWVPGDVVHATRSAKPFEHYIVFIDPLAAGGMPVTSCTILATPLLRELLIRAASLPVEHNFNCTELHLVELLLAEIETSPVERLRLPMPKDPRVRRIAEQMIADPAHRGTVRSWAAELGMSERSFARLLVRETGMSFGRWRRQLAIMGALRWLAEGMSIQETAANLGYENAGSFATMFRKSVGTSPARYAATTMGLDTRQRSPQLRCPEIRAG